MIHMDTFAEGEQAKKIGPEQAFALLIRIISYNFATD